ncbi:ATP-binding protein [Solitalea longa]|uniref:ATP-binding protein n=1 Tax=Solitalea longa TaxID=2079460 RepID=A0A2S4ZXY9_9SPHI|nr:diphthine--ammonia ligase [Solitalea longa]POY34867.1 ATP-binding protein [Solitalea longa]
MERIKTALFWSGGKDSAFALYDLLNQSDQFEVCCLITTVNEEFKRISMHGVREELLDWQAQRIGMPLKKMYVPASCTNEDYENALNKVFIDLKNEGITTIVYGDIFLEDLKLYRENLLNKAGLNGYFPLWKQDTAALVAKFMNLGFLSVVCCVKSEILDREFCGKIITTEFIAALPKNVDPCGENGEFHSFCFDGPLFSKAIEFELGETVFKPYSFKTDATEKEQGFWFTDLISNDK